MSGLLRRLGRLAAVAVVLLGTLMVSTSHLAAQAQEAAGAERGPGGEASLVLPDLSTVQVGGFESRALLAGGLVVAVIGILFGLLILNQLKNLPVHRSMREISELIYETCKTYLQTQGKFLMLLEVFIAVVIVLYFGVLQHLEALRVAIILVFSMIGIAGSYGVAWFGIRINTVANSRAAFSALALPAVALPAEERRRSFRVGVSTYSFWHFI